MMTMMQARSQKCEIGGGQMMKVEGQHVERQRRENRGAVGAEGSGVGGGGVPFPNGGGVWGGGCAPPQKFF